MAHIVDIEEKKARELVEKKSKIANGAQHEGWWDGPARYQNVNRNPITAAQRDALFSAVAALAPGKIGFDIGGPGFEVFGHICLGLNIVEGAKTVVADAMFLPFKDNSIDFYVSSHALEHIIDVKKAFIEMVRTLKPGGIMGHKMPDIRYFQHDNLNPNHTQPELAPNEMTAEQMLEILKSVEGIEILLFDTHQNNFDFEILARKKG